MRFSQKLTLLIIGCVLVLAALCLIQYRLVQNTYRLEKATYFADVKEQLAVKSQELSDSLNKEVMQELLGTLKSQLNREMKPHLLGFQDKINKKVLSYRRQMSKVLQQDSLLQNIGYNFEYTSIIVYHGASADTLLSERSPSLLLAGTGKGTYFISQGKQETGFGLQQGLPMARMKMYRLAVVNRTRINASHWQQTVTRHMAATLAGSALLIAAVIIIYCFIFAALLRQKRIAEITTDFANNMTHELKTPLSAAGLVVKSLRIPEAKLDEQWYEELLIQLDRQHEKIRRLMDNVLTSALDRHTGIVKMERLQLHTVLQDLQLVAEASRRQLVCTVKTGDILYTDKTLLTSILSNLLDNAIKYAHASSILTVNVEHNQDGSISIRLADEGPGIAHKYQRYLFEKYFRLPQPDTVQINGLGLGLYLCRMQAIQLNGKLTYERNMNGGSTFNLTLPDAKDTYIAC